MIDKIKQAISNAEQLKSNLDKNALSIPGYTSIKIRHLMNNLGSISTNYLEIGVHKGGTFCSAIKNNPLVSAIAVDDFSEFNGDNPKSQFLKNVASCRHGSTEFYLINTDCWSHSVLDPFRKFDLFLYDGSHSEECQRKACFEFVPYMCPKFIFCVDDYSKWPHVKKSTQEGILESGCRILFETELWNGKAGDNGGWHNGFYVALLQKP